MSDNMNTDTTSSGNLDTTATYLGRVKWFNNKAGYGFVTIVRYDIGESDRVGEDVFVHHTGVKVDSEQYKYLVQGEYASFNLKESDGDTHPYQANNLTGIAGGKLMCETRNEQRQQREERDGERGDGERDGGDGRDSNRGQHGSRSRRQVRPRGSGPRDDRRVWALVDPEGGGGGGGDRRNTRRRPQRDRRQHDEY